MGLYWFQGGGGGGGGGGGSVWYYCIWIDFSSTIVFEFLWDGVL